MTPLNIPRRRILGEVLPVATVAGVEGLTGARAEAAVAPDRIRMGIETKEGRSCGWLFAMAKLIALLLLTLSWAAGAAGQVPAPPLDPFSAKSASGEYSVWENPQSIGGNGPATYRLSRNGHLLWERRLPITFEKLGISNSGVFGGYGSFEEARNHYQFLVALISPDGSVRRRYVEDYGPIMLDGPAYPEGWSVFVDDGLGRMVVGISGELGDRIQDYWRCYRLADGVRLPNVTPEILPGWGSMVAAAYVPDTPYTLVNWQSGRSSTDGAFTLMDRVGHIVWTRRMPGDYDGLPFPEASIPTSVEIFRKGAILAVGQHGEFEVRFVRAAQRVRFRVDPSSGQVAEVGREPFAGNRPTRVDVARVPTITLRSKGKFVFPLKPKTRSPIHDIDEFSVLANGHIVFSQITDSVTVVEIDRTGRLVRKVVVPFAPKSRIPFARLDDEHFIVGQQSDKVGRPSVIWQADLRKGQARTLCKVPGGLGEAASDGRGGFAFETDGGFCDFDRAGNLRWKSGALTGEGLILDGSGHFLTVDPVLKRLNQYDPAGKLVGSKDLKPILGQQAGYSYRLTSLADGGLVIDNMESFAVLDKTYRLRGRITPQLSDGRLLVWCASAQTDRKGDLWVTNGKALYRLDAKGVATAITGFTPDLSAFVSVGGMTVDRYGAVYAVNSLNGDVLVFGHDGNLRRRASPTPGKLDELPADAATVEVAPSGDIYVDYQNAMSGSGLGQWRFAPDGRSLGYQSYDEQAPASDFTASGPDWRWYRDALIDGQGKVRARLNRWPDGTWYEEWAGDGRLVAPDQSVAMMSNRYDWHSYRFGFFAPDGRPLSMAPSPLPIMEHLHGYAYDGVLVYIYTGTYIYAIDRTGKPIWKFAPPQAVGQYFRILPWDNGLGLFDGKATIYWFAQPE